MNVSLPQVRWKRKQEAASAVSCFLVLCELRYLFFFAFFLATDHPPFALPREIWTALVPSRT